MQWLFLLYLIFVAFASMDVEIVIVLSVFIYTFYNNVFSIGVHISNTKLIIKSVIFVIAILILGLFIFTYPDYFITTIYNDNGDTVNNIVAYKEVGVQTEEIIDTFYSLDVSQITSFNDVTSVVSESELVKVQSEVVVNIINNVYKEVGIQAVENINSVSSLNLSQFTSFSDVTSVISEFNLVSIPPKIYDITDLQIFEQYFSIPSTEISKMIINETVFEILITDSGIYTYDPELFLPGVLSVLYKIGIARLSF